jgi:hypothetical protein
VSNKKRDIGGEPFPNAGVKKKKNWQEEEKKKSPEIVSERTCQKQKKRLWRERKKVVSYNIF